MNAIPLDEIRQGFVADRIPKVRVAPLYRMGLVLVTVAMVLLPLVYLALIAATAWGVWWYADFALPIFESLHGRGLLLALVLYVTPLLAGSMVVFFMLKPLLARRSKGPEPHQLRPGEHPALEEFVARICRAVGAPLPRRIKVTCDVNASASPSGGFFSLLARNLDLTIGLPLAGLPVHSFGGILAHEFGHFTQGGGMTLTYLIRSINHWFARVVYERDAWDERLENAAAEAGDWRLQVPLFVCRGAVWLSRRVLWLLMHAGHAISCFAMRQMEYDADACEAGFAGSAAFAETCRRMREIGQGHLDAAKIVRNGWQDGRLARNLPQMACERAAVLSAEVCRAAHEQAEARKTGIWDTHPCDADRIRAAAALQLDGIFSLDTPAAGLFHDFAGLCELSTLLFYRDQVGLNLEKAELVDHQVLVGDADALRDAQAALKSFFHGRIDLGRPWVPELPDLATAVPQPAEIAALAGRLDAAGTALAEEFEAFDAAEARLFTCLRAEALATAGFTIQPKEFGLETGTALSAKAGAAAARKEMARLAEVLEPFNRLAAEKLAAGLHVAMAADPAQREPVASSIRVLGQLAPALAVANRLRETLVTHNVLLDNIQAKVSGMGVALETNAKRAKNLLESLDPLLVGIPYPFDHAPPMDRLLDVVLAAEAEAAEAEAPDWLKQIMRAGAVVDRIYPFAFRLLGSLAATAEAAVAAKPAHPHS